jgi:predicted nucleotidyltransferase
MSAIDRLARQAAHRDAWLRDVVQRLEKDVRFSATWLVGSLADGSADGLSDIDLFVVIDDRHAEAVLQRSTEEVARFGQTVWLQEVSGNAPSGGAYMSVGFQSSPLPIGVDWYLQPLRQAVLPSDARLLFQKTPIPKTNPPASFAELMSRRRPPLVTKEDRTPPSDLDRLAFFWAMVPVAAKYGARGWDEKTGRILDGLEEQVDKLGASGAANRCPDEGTVPLQRLRLLLNRMDRLTPILRARGVPAPDTSYAFAFVRLAEELHQEGWH